MSHETLEDLLEGQRRLNELVKLQQDLINRHPEHILKKIYRKNIDLANPRILGNILWIKDISGVTNSEKNKMTYQGCSFQLKGEERVWEYQHGSNWCSTHLRLRHSKMAWNEKGPPLRRASDITADIEIEWEETGKEFEDEDLIPELAIREATKIWSEAETWSEEDTENLPLIVATLWALNNEEW